jgi:GWxTD domain-containing protein
LFLSMSLPQGLMAQRPSNTRAICATEVEIEEGSALDAARRLIAAGESCSDWHAFDSALDALAPSLYSRESTAEAWYLAGKAKVALAKLGIIARARVHQQIGASYIDGGIAALRRALSLDPAHAGAAALLADPAIRRIANADPTADLALIQEASDRSPKDARLLLVRARLELRSGRSDDALRATQRLLELGTDSGSALLEQARALMMSHRLDDGYASWLEGFRLARSNASMAAYRQDVQWIATTGELAEFDSLASGSARLAWARRFWDRRAAADFRVTAERVSEHERRVQFAISEFPLQSPDRAYNRAMPYRSSQSEVDDRGVVYVRHGPPSRVLRSGSESTQDCPVYSWLYEDGPDRGLTVHFRPFFTLLISTIRFCAIADFKLVPGGTWIDKNAIELARYDSLYSDWLEARRRPVLRQRIGRAIVAEEVDRLALAVSSDAHPLSFDRDLHAVVRSYGLGNPGRLLVAFGVPNTSLDRISLNGRAVIPLRLRIAALPRNGGEALTLDTTIAYDASRTLRADQWIVGWLEIPAPAGEFEVRSLAAGADPLAGSFGLQLPVVVPSSVPGQPSVSALVLGTTESELRWPAPGGPFPLSALNSYARHTDIEVFLSSEGLRPDTDVEVRFRLAPTKHPTRSAAGLRFTERIRTGRLVLRQSISIGDAEPGYYTLSIEIRTAAGQVVTHSQKVAISP